MHLAFFIMLFAYLVAFSSHGGIQKFNRCFLKAASEWAVENNTTFLATSPYDSFTLPEYLGLPYLKHSKNKICYFFSTLFYSLNHKIIVIGHVNLWPVGLAIKCLFPYKKIVLIAHGIEVWRPLPLLAKLFLKLCSQIWCVSHYTGYKIGELHGISPNRIKVFHNTLDPYFSLPHSFIKPEYLLKRYKIKPDTHVFASITRLTFIEKSKGCDRVLETLALLEEKNWVYILGGKYDEDEYVRLNTLITELRLTDKVILPGYIDDAELADHYLLSDTFIMLSKKEGFGIVFIEAAACGCSVIAGNTDGSVDAMLNGQLGQLVNPDSDTEVVEALEKSYNTTLSHTQKLTLQNTVVENFSFAKYKSRFSAFMSSISS